MDTFAKLPLAFEANQGQADSRVAFMAHGIAYSVFLTKQEAVLDFDRTRRPEERPAHGPCRRQSRPRRLRPGADSPGKAIISSGTTLRSGAPAFPASAACGTKRFTPASTWSTMAIAGSLSMISWPLPAPIRPAFACASPAPATCGWRRMAIWSSRPAARRSASASRSRTRTSASRRRNSVDGRFVLRGAGEAGFRLGAYDHSQALVIDPVIVRSTYLGGKGKDLGYSIAVDAQGAVYVTGSTTSAAGFPLPGCFDCLLGGPMDAFVTKFLPNGTGFFYSTYLGGSGSDAGFGIAADANGNAYVTGETDSNNFPAIGAVFPVFGGGPWDAFVTALNPGGFPIYSTYLGGKGADIGHGIAVDPVGNAVVTGSTNSPNLPVLGCFQCGPQGGTDAFVAGFTPVGGLRFSSYFGGAGNDIGYGISLDANEEIGITGSTTSHNLPVLACPQCVNHGGEDAFASAFIFPGPALILKWSTYWGGEKNDVGYGIVMDSVGEAWITGDTDSLAFPRHGQLRAVRERRRPGRHRGAVQFQSPSRIFGLSGRRPR